MTIWLVVLGAAILGGCVSETGDPDMCAGPRDTDCDGDFTALDGEDCERCVTVCYPSGGWECEIDGDDVPMELDLGNSCSTSDDLDDHRRVTIDCSSGIPTCVVDEERRIAEGLPPQPTEGTLREHPVCRVTRQP